MKIIITESQTDKLIERILDSEDITYSMKYMGRTYGAFGAEKYYDHVFFRFYFPNGDEYERKVSFVTEEDGILRFSGSDIFSKSIDELKYIPSEVVTDYFAERARIYLEKVLNM
jgi:hypothetical protein